MTKALLNNTSHSILRMEWLAAGFLSILSIVFLTSGCVGSDTTEYEEEIDFDDPELPARLTRAFETWVDERGIYGSAISIVAGDFEWTSETGVVLLDEFPAYDTSTVQRVGSATKPMTAVIILQLIEEGLLTLDTTMDNYFPTYPNADQITVELLLRHRSGIYDVTLDDLSFIGYIQGNGTTWIEVEDLLLWTYDSGGSIPSEINSLREGGLIPRGPACAPDACVHYSQPGYQVLGYIIESITGQSVQDVYEERIFEPLGMGSTFLPRVDQTNPPIGYTNVFGLLSSKIATNLILPSLNSFNSSALTAGGVNSNVDDLMIFMQALMKGRLVSSNSLDLMQDWMLWWEDEDASVKRWDYGMGLNIAYHDDGEDYVSIRHGGSVPGSGCEMLYFPEWDMYVTLTRNTDQDSVASSTPRIEERLVRAIRKEPFVKDRDTVEE